MDGWMDGWMYVCMFVCMYNLDEKMAVYGPGVCSHHEPRTRTLNPKPGAAPCGRETPTPFEAEKLRDLAMGLPAATQVFGVQPQGVGLRVVKGLGAQGGLGFKRYPIFLILEGSSSNPV